MKGSKDTEQDCETLDKYLLQQWEEGVGMKIPMRCNFTKPHKTHNPVPEWISAPEQEGRAESERKLLRKDVPCNNDPSSIPGGMVTNGKNWPCNRTVGVLKQRKHRVGGTKKAPRRATTPLTYKVRGKANARTFVGTSPWKVQDVELSVSRCLLFPVCISKGICQYPLWKPTEAAFMCSFLQVERPGRGTGLENVHEWAVQNSPT